MNEYKFIDLIPGQRESFKHTVTDEDMRSFLSITGDENPLHTDSVFAESQGFKSEVVYGMLSASLISTLAGVYLPGKFCIIHQVDIKFVRPVYVGDVLVVSGTVNELNESVQQAVIKVEIINQNIEKVIRGKLSVGFLE